jgi:hypothetical protein
MERLFCRLKERYYRRGRRGGVAFQGLRKLEVTYNPIRDDYHPHYHFILRGKAMGEQLVEDWLKGWKGTDRDAQECKPADDKSAKELFKYFTKIISSKSKVADRRIYPVELDWIFRVMRGKRTFQNFGFIPTQVIEDKSVIDKFAEEVDSEMFWIWKENFTDWVNATTGEFLTEYSPSEGMKKLFSHI